MVEKSDVAAVLELIRPSLQADGGDDVQLVAHADPFVAHGCDKPLHDAERHAEEHGDHHHAHGWHRAHAHVSHGARRPRHAALEVDEAPHADQGEQGYDHLRRVDGQQADDQVRHGCEQQRRHAVVHRALRPQRGQKLGPQHHDDAAAPRR